MAFVHFLGFATTIVAPLDLHHFLGLYLSEVRPRHSRHFTWARRT
jgi:hypothetical protein